jgi:hypothetical protein
MIYGRAMTDGRANVGGGATVGGQVLRTGVPRVGHERADGRREVRAAERAPTPDDDADIIDDWLASMSLDDFEVVLTHFLAERPSIVSRSVEVPATLGRTLDSAGRPARLDRLLIMAGVLTLVSSVVLHLAHW